MKESVDDNSFDETIHNFFENSGDIRLALDFGGSNGQILSVATGIETVEIFYELLEHGAVLTAVRKHNDEVTVESIEVNSLKLEDILHETIQLASDLHREAGDDSEW